MFKGNQLSIDLYGCSTVPAFSGWQPVSVSVWSPSPEVAISYDEKGVRSLESYAKEIFSCPPEKQKTWKASTNGHMEWGWVLSPIQ